MGMTGSVIWPWKYMDMIWPKPRRLQVNFKSSWKGKGAKDITLSRKDYRMEYQILFDGKSWH